ncbi:MAG: CcoQ/FixQ family Cbb3-type cytochrome c oxidase assembly chaperone [Flavobacteriales bacterium]|nr:CcoQ/FixQ family Cbb3-type cytochrome c oxidase assembly chaperone [Flavobacteriales bacterium]
MLNFVKHHMDSIAGIEIYPILSFLIFFTFFLGLFVYVLLMRKGYVEELENLPLNEND